jgi:hypothetical protein
VWLSRQSAKVGLVAFFVGMNVLIITKKEFNRDSGKHNIKMSEKEDLIDISERNPVQNV